jgi:hypothetical protein
VRTLRVCVYRYHCDPDHTSRVLTLDGEFKLWGLLTLDPQSAINEARDYAEFKGQALEVERERRARKCREIECDHCYG